MQRNWQVFSDPDGDLVPINFSELPFTPKRVFYVNNVPAGQERGCHAHYKCQQILICLQGQVLVRTHDGKRLTEQTLNPNDCAFIDNMTWDSQVFVTGKEILLSLCSTEYDKSDYIEDFDKFLDIKRD